MNPPLRLLTTFQQERNKTADWVVAVEGRDMWIAADIIKGHHYIIIAPDLSGRVVFDRQSAKQKRNIRNRPLPRWARYVSGALLTLGDLEIPTPTVTAMIVGEEPAGPRYEHALGMAFAALCYTYAEKEFDTDTLLNIMEKVQKEYL